MCSYSNDFNAAGIRPFFNRTLTLSQDHRDFFSLLIKHRDETTMVGITTVAELIHMLIQVIV